jgi:protein ImuB
MQVDPRSMAVLLAEVSAEIGAQNVGVLELVPVHRPEARTKLVPLEAIAEGLSRSSLESMESSKWGCDEEFPTRLLAEPVPLPIFAGQKPMVTIDKQIFDVEAKSHSMRFEAVEWWTAAPVCRDYARVLLTSGAKRVEAWVFTDRTTGRAFLHGYFD